MFRQLLATLILFTLPALAVAADNAIDEARRLQTLPPQYRHWDIKGGFEVYGEFTEYTDGRVWLRPKGSKVVIAWWLSDFEYHDRGYLLDEIDRRAKHRKR